LYLVYFVPVFVLVMRDARGIRSYIDDVFYNNSNGFAIGRTWQSSSHGNQHDNKEDFVICHLSGTRKSSLTCAFSTHNKKMYVNNKKENQAGPAAAPPLVVTSLTVPLPSSDHRSHSRRSMLPPQSPPIAPHLSSATTTATPPQPPVAKIGRGT
jgi:hypothetical protein